MQSVSSNILLSPGTLNEYLSIGIQFRERGTSEYIDSRKGLGFNLCVAPFAKLRVLNFRGGSWIGIAGMSSETRGRQEDEVEVKTEYQ